MSVDAPKVVDWLLRSYRVRACTGAQHRSRRRPGLWIMGNAAIPGLGRRWWMAVPLRMTVR
jgi:hypothetical protein